MSNGKIYINNIGVEIIVDISPCKTTGATKTELWIKRPDGIQVIWTDAIIDESHLKFVTKPGDLNISGAYKAQVHLEFPDQVIDGAVDSFYVCNLFE